MPGRGRWQRLRFWLRARQGIPWWSMVHMGYPWSRPQSSLGRSTNLQFFCPPKEPHYPDFFQIVLPVSFNFPQVLDSVKLFQFSIDLSNFPNFQIFQSIFPWFSIDFPLISHWFPIPAGLGRRALRLAPPWRGPWPSAAAWLGAAGGAMDFFSGDIWLILRLS